jgi:hypothetical protein
MWGLVLQSEQRRRGRLAKRGGVGLGWEVVQQSARVGGSAWQRSRRGVWGCCFRRGRAMEKRIARVGAWRRKLAIKERRVWCARRSRSGWPAEKNSRKGVWNRRG